MKMNFNLPVTPLANVPSGQVVRVRALLGPGKGMRLRLATLGLHTGARVRVLGHGPGFGPVLLEIDGTQIAIGRGLARRVMVVPESSE